MAITYWADKGQAITRVEYDATIRHLDERPDGQVYPKDKNIGIKVDTNSPDWAWEDLIGDMQYGMSSAAGISASPVVYIGTIAQAQFDVGDSQTYLFHIPHEWVQNHNAYIHVHWSHNSPSVTTGNVSFQCEVIAARSHNTKAFGTPKLINVTQAASVTRFQHMLAEAPFCESLGGLGDTLIHSEDMEPDTLIICNVKLTGNSMNGGALPFVHTVDLHYQTTSIGTKNRSPDFWE